MIRYIEKIVKWFEDIFKLPSTGRFDGDLDLPQEAVDARDSRFHSRLKYQLRRFFFLLRRRRGLILRALMCWTIGVLALHLDEVGSYDFRLSLRGNQDPSKDIVLLTINPEDLKRSSLTNNSLNDLKSDIPLSSDSKYWNQKIWNTLLHKLLEMEPKSIGVSFFFNHNVGPHLTPSEWDLFTNPKIIWMGTLSQGGLVQLPPFADPNRQNYGYGEFYRDEDGMLRSVGAVNLQYPSFTQRLAETFRPGMKTPYPQAKSVINFRGSGHSFLHLPLRELLAKDLPKALIQDKIVIIGSEADPLSGFPSPVGRLSRAEVMAHITDNLIHHRWIQRLPKPAAIFELFMVMLVSVFLMNYFPQKVAFVFLSILSLALSCLSIWFFDTFYLWTPAFSPLLQILGTWTLFVGYLASRMEHKNWQLEHEKKSLAQLEQLKNNFVSLISHDLKTPIAKIQAIVDRLLLNEHPPELTQDLRSLRGSSHELHRYIQSILKILRVESKDFHLNIEVADINDLVEKAIRQLQPLASEKRITIETSLEPLFSMEVDGTLMQEVFGNIIENAIKYTPDGGKVVIETGEVDQNVLIRITDTGEGISPEELDNVFGKFVRGKNQDLKTKGTGLGLYLVKYFIELHGGSVSLTSQVGKGTSVDLYLPTVS